MFSGIRWGKRCQQDSQCVQNAKCARTKCSECSIWLIRPTQCALYGLFGVRVLAFLPTVANTHIQRIQY